MTIWIIAIVLLALFAVGGYYAGVVRSLVSLIGMIIALFLAMPLGPIIKGVVPAMGLTHPVWSLLLPPLLVFIVLELIFFGLGFAANHPVAHYFKYRAEDVVRIKWERLTARLGACVGLVSGIIHVCVIGVLLYAPCYLTSQVASDKDPGSLQFANKLRADMQTAGLDKIVVRFDPFPKRYYEISDLLGIIYNNPLLLGRLSQYPPLFKMSERQEFQEAGKDADFMKLFTEQASAVDIVNNARILGLVGNGEITTELLGLDLKDLRTYLEKGKSPIYDPIKLLGRWELDIDQVILNAKKANPDISVKELRALQGLLLASFTQVTFTATTDKQVVLKGMVTDFSSVYKAAAAQAAAPQANAQQQRRVVSTSATSIVGILDRRMDERYGRFMNRPAAAAPQAAPDATPEPPKQEAKTFEGTWDGEGERYTLKFAGMPGGESKDAEAVIEGDTMQVPLFGQKLAFVRLQ